MLEVLVLLSTYGRELHNLLGEITPLSYWRFNMINFTDLFNQTDPTEELESVILLPYTTRPEDVNKELSIGSHKWSDFEYVEIGMGITSDDYTYVTTRLEKVAIDAQPTNWNLACNWSTGNYWESTIRALSANSFKFTSKSNESTGKTMSVRYMVGYKKRFATKNLSKIINVNNGNNIGVNQRYEIDIAAELGQDYLGRDLIVQAEIYVSNEWTQSTWVTVRDGGAGTNAPSKGISAGVLDTKIIVKTGTTLLDNGTGHLLPDGASSSSAPCRVKVWKIDQYITDLSARIAGGGSGLLKFIPIAEEPYTAQINEGYLVQLDDAIIGSNAVVTLPATGKVGEYVAVGDGTGICSAEKAITVKGLIHSKQQDFYITRTNAVVWFTWINETQGWHIVTGIGEGGSGSDLPYVEVDVLPFDKSRTPSNGISLPKGYRFSDFEYLEVIVGVKDGDYAFNTGRITKEHLQVDNDRLFLSYLNSNDASGRLVAGVAWHLTSNTLDVLDADSNPSVATVYQIKGYTKYKPATANIPYEEVNILPLGYYKETDVTNKALPSGYTWESFERIEVGVGTNNAGDNRIRGTEAITKDVIASIPDGQILVTGHIEYGNTVKSINVAKGSVANTISLNGQTGTDSVVRYVKGYTLYKPVVRVPTVYPMPWEDLHTKVIAPYTATAENLMGRWVDEETYHVIGILTVNSANDAVSMLQLPSMSINKAATQFAPSTVDASIRSYTQLPAGSDKLQVVGAKTSAWLMINHTLRLQPIN